MARAARVGARDKLRTYFLANVGRVLDGDDLRPIAGDISEWARRVRELRNEEGLQIQTHHDRSDLKPGQYVLVDSKPLPAFSRAISKETRALVLDRNGVTCQMCGAMAGERHPDDPARRPVRLHIGHIVDKSKGGSDSPDNLRALCSLCNEGAQNATTIRPDVKQLLVAIRRAPTDVQLTILEWLRRKFPDHRE